MSHSHRSVLKQSNKPFKTSHASKRTLKRTSKGRVDLISHPNPNSLSRNNVRKTVISAEEARANRRNAAKLALLNKKAKVQHSSQFFSGRFGVPKIVTVIPLCTDSDIPALMTVIHKSVNQNYEPSSAVSVMMEAGSKQRIQFLLPPRNVLNILDAIKLSDYAIFVLSAKVEVDPFGELILTSILAQGLPTCIPVVQFLDSATQSHQEQWNIRKSLISYMSYWCPDTEKVFSLDNPAECIHLIRQMTGRSPKPMSWRDQYPYMIPDIVSTLPASNGSQDFLDLTMTGFVRGNRLSANRLIHLPGIGDYQVSSIASAKPFTHHSMEMETAPTILDTPNSDADDLIALNELDPMMNDQTWPTEQEILEADHRIKRRRVPKGTSAYQAAWIVDSDSDDQVNDNEMDMEQLEAEKHDWAFHPLPASTPDSACVFPTHQTLHSKMDCLKIDRQSDLGSDSDHGHMSQYGNGSEAGNEDSDDDYENILPDDRASVWDDKMDKAEQARQLESYLEQRKNTLADEQEDIAFPDEVETPLTVPAKVRFARYRGLKSISKSVWDPNENLPAHYGQVFHFENWQRTRARVTKDVREHSAVGAGSYVTVTLRNVPQHVRNLFHLPSCIGQHPNENGPTALFWIVGLLPFEHKFTTMHFTARRREEYVDPIRSKDPLIVQLGWRRFNSAPVWSEHGRDSGNHVFKFERFFKQKHMSVGTVYAPTCYYGPALVFHPSVTARKTETDVFGLVATGSILEANANRIITKRVVLTGHPYKLHRKIAVVRWMFYSPEDTLWFKPVQLFTKNGRTGHIRESLGTHGYMKCIFDGPIQQNDTVCMSLYKRMFPKVFASLITPTM